MFHKKSRFFLLSVIVFLLTFGPIAQAAPPLQEEGGTTVELGGEGGTTEGDSLNLDENGKNLGTIMKNRKDATTTDTDGDGIPDVDEGTGDTDGDGIPDYLESNTNNPDGDDFFDFEDVDSDGDGILDADEGLADTDNDTVPNYLDLDSDGDEILDIDEGIVDAGGEIIDTDGDGIPDYLESNTNNPDGDDFFDFEDVDSDGDGILDAVEGLEDTDGDGTPNYLDLDSDGDGISDEIEGETDTDGDGIPDYLDDGGTQDGDSNVKHPVANAIADYFNVPPKEVMGIHIAGNGFGNIPKHYWMMCAAQAGVHF
jgi:hypothetical protein